ncbi:hypothetical protein OAF63_01840 [Saprospiraceae bacterium]|jgi:hypothetical protein|nr:hypothetical protein [Saprospiraceae bacterium]MDF1866988.1 hypothetical protein [Saprospiraceae bacterium]
MSIFNRQFSICCGIHVFCQLLFLMLLFSIYSCSKPIEKQVIPTFYHWKTNFELSDIEVDYLDSFKIKKLYIKFFDVDWDFDKKDAIPKADINFKTILDNIDIIPTIFITNRTFENISEKEIPELAKKTQRKIFALSTQIPGLKIREIQLDCDWTLSTKEKFFDFIDQFNNYISKEGVISSATIRLHQIKFFEKTGIPPVDRGMLMFYNMGDIENWLTENSILDLEIGKQYFKNFEKYPLDLDVALPIFHWGILFRDGQMIRILNNLSEIDLKDESRFRRIEKNRFQVIKSTYLNGHYLYEGDLFRLESIKQYELEASVNELNQLIKNPKITIAFYHLDSLNISNFPKDSLKIIQDAFH